MAAVVVTATGHPLYGLSAHQTVRSVIDHTDFDVVVGCDEANEALLPRSDRIRLVRVDHRDRHRADPFLAKFEVWRQCLATTSDELIVHLDADSALVTAITDDDLLEALGAGHLAMVEQTSIAGSTMDRASFLDHHLTHSHRFLVPRLTEPTIDRFRFHNSGVIIFLRTELQNLVCWAEELRLERSEDHTSGEHMIADQDYLQVWTNTVRPGACTDLDATWNHCPWWDADYPRPDARIVHLSNFCNGPEVRTALELQEMRRARLRTPTTEPWHEISFCVVTHQSGSVIGDCVDALQRFEGAELIVVDNASDDSTITELEGRGIDAHRSPVNTGYAAAANRAAGLASRPTLVFVNPDCFVHHGALEGMAERLREDPDLVLVADVVHEDGRVVPGIQNGYSASRLAKDMVDSTPLGVFAENLRTELDGADQTWSWPLGTCLALRRARFEQLGGFDESFFVYMEDVEFGRSLHADGGAIETLPTAVLHLGARGSSIDPLERTRILTNARIDYARRHHGRVLAIALRALATTGRLVGATRARTVRR